MAIGDVFAGSHPIGRGLDAFEVSEYFLALERGAARPLLAPQATPLLQRDPTAIWKVGLAVSVLFNLLLIYWLLFLPK